jgi:tRNA threonylcarbamoyl adenosine modification protein (Sua5/YciO/YrdC/YwlC family)
MVIAQINQGESPAKVVIEIVKRLERGEILILPTDTVYGIHALSRNASAVARIRAIKGQPAHRPLSNLYSTVAGLSRFVKFPEGEYKRQILESWPGAVTWVLPAQPDIIKHNVGSDNTIGIRIPDHQLLRSVCSSLDSLIVSTSANFHGKPAPSSRDEISKDLIRKVDGVVFQSGRLPGQPSEVKRWTPAGSEILRTFRNIKELTEKANVLLVCSGNTCRSPMAEGFLRSKLEAGVPGRFSVRSAGTSASIGMRASLPAVEVMREKDIEINNHRSRRIDEEIVEWADVILCMTSHHMGILSDNYPTHSGKIFLYSTFPSVELHGEYGIKDPVGENVEIYREIRNQIEIAADRVVPHLRDLVG